MKKQKEHVTLMSSANATGTHKLPSVLIDKFKNPRRFNNVNKSSLL